MEENNLTSSILADEDLLKALSSKRRKEILKKISQEDYTIPELADEFGISTQGINKHIRFLEKANLIKTEKIENARGKPNKIKLTERFLSENLKIPSLMEVSDFEKAWKLVQYYRESLREIKRKKIEIPDFSLKQSIVFLSEDSWEDVASLSREQLEKKLLNIFGVESENITYDVGWWIETKIEDMIENRGKENVDPLEPPSHLRTLEFRNGIDLNIGNYEGLQKIPEDIEPTVEKMPQTRDWLGYVLDILNRSLHIVILYAKGIYIRRILGADKEIFNYERELEASDSPVSDLAIEIVKAIRNSIPEGNEKALKAWGDTFRKCIEVLKNQLEIIEDERDRISLPFTKKGSAQFKEELMSLEKSIKKILLGVLILEEGYPILEEIRPSLSLSKEELEKSIFQKTEEKGGGKTNG